MNSYGFGNILLGFVLQICESYGFKIFEVKIYDFYFKITSPR